MSEQSIWTHISHMLFSLVKLIISLLFVLPGNIMIFPLTAAVSIKGEQERIKALKKSVVKVKATDVLASFKLKTYIVTFPLYLISFTYVYNFALRNYFEMSFSDALYPTAVFFMLFPLLQLLSIMSHSNVQQNYNDFQARFVSLFYPNQVSIIKQARATLKKKIDVAVDSAGPKFIPNFEKERLIVKDPRTHL